MLQYWKKTVDRSQLVKSWWSFLSPKIKGQSAHNDKRENSCPDSDWEVTCWNIGCAGNVEVGAVRESQKVLK